MSKGNPFFFTKFVYESLFRQILKKNYSGAYLEPIQTSKMELFVKIVNALKFLMIFTKNSILDKSLNYILYCSGKILQLRYLAFLSMMIRGVFSSSCI